MILTPDTSRIIEMAWEDRTPFEAIQMLYGLSEPDVILLMRKNLKSKVFRNWRARVSGRASKHLAYRNPEISRGYCKTQYKIRANKGR
nr:TIGR03643 family protein [Marinomonas alcarazii]